MHPFFISARPAVFAHRGGGALAPENTVAAFERGLSLGADGIELDVHLSRDGLVVVHHDDTVDRTTDGTGRISDLTADELARLDAGYRFRNEAGHPFRRCGIGVPRLAEVLSRFRGARVIIELKGGSALTGGSASLARATVDAVRAADAVDRVCIGSKWMRGLRVVRTMEPSIATSAAREEVRLALYRSWIRMSPRARARYDGFQVPETAEGFRIVSPRFVAAVNRGGRAVQVWTVNSEDDARRLLGWGVQALITDRPDLMVPLVRDVRQDTR
jgi:glycerophosphoryl diester phosphodiesterase